MLLKVPHFALHLLAPQHLDWPLVGIQASRSIPPGMDHSAPLPQLVLAAWLLVRYLSVELSTRSHTWSKHFKVVWHLSSTNSFCDCTYRDICCLPCRFLLEKFEQLAFNFFLLLLKLVLTDSSNLAYSCDLIFCMQSTLSLVDHTFVALREELFCCGFLVH